MLGCVFTSRTTKGIDYHLTEFHRNDCYSWCFLCGFCSKVQDEVLYTHVCVHEEERMTELDKLDQLDWENREAVPSTSSSANDLQSSKLTREHAKNLLSKINPRRRPRIINPSNRFITHSDQSTDDDERPLAEDSSDIDFDPVKPYKSKKKPIVKRKKKKPGKKVPGKRGRPRKVDKDAGHKETRPKAAVRSSPVANKTILISDPPEISKISKVDENNNEQKPA